MLRLATLAALAAACGDGGGAADAGIDARPFDIGDAAACSGSTEIFLAGEGGAYRGGEVSDSRTNQSELLGNDTAVQVDPYPFGDDAWTEVIACVGELLAPYDVLVTDVDPGSAPHFEIVVTTGATHLGLPKGSLAATPLSCDRRDNGVGFVFAGSLGESAVLTCMAVVSELGHLLGLDHVLDCADAMSEAPGCNLDDPARRFTDVDARCGLAGPGRCVCSGEQTQRAHLLLLDRLGACSD